MTDWGAKARAVLNRVCKWRMILVGWQLGTRAIGDPEGDAVRDHREATLVLRVELSAVIACLIERGVMTREQFSRAVVDEGNLLDQVLEQRFPGMKSSATGMVIDPVVAAETMKGWKP